MIYQQPAEQLKIQAPKPQEFRIAWLFPQSDLITNPSARLRRYQISQYLSKLYGLIHSDNIFYYESRANLKTELLAYDVVVIFNIVEFDWGLCLFLKDNGKIVIFDHCENIFGLGHEDLVMENVSAITCCSTTLAVITENYLRNRGLSKPIFVIRDPIDDSALDLPLPRTVNFNNRALVMGMGANVQYVLPFLDSLCDETGYEILIISEHIPVALKHLFEVWTPYTWMEQARTCTVALCYHDKDKFPAKGNVKVTAPMALGLPVIAPPIGSYLEAIDSGVNGYIASERSDWINALYQLKNPHLRLSMGLMARQKALTNYSTEKIGLDYLFMLNYLRG